MITLHAAYKYTCTCHICIYVYVYKFVHVCTCVCVCMSIYMSGLVCLSSFSLVMHVPCKIHILSPVRASCVQRAIFVLIIITILYIYILTTYSVRACISNSCSMHAITQPPKTTYLRPLVRGFKYTNLEERPFSQGDLKRI